MQPDKPGIKRKQHDDSDSNDKPKAKRPAAGSKESEKEKLLSVCTSICYYMLNFIAVLSHYTRNIQMLEADETEAMDESSLKKMILQFEKRVTKNQEMRIKHADSPEK